MSNNEMPLIMISALTEEDDQVTFQTGFSRLLDDNMTQEERDQINAAIDKLLDLVEPVFMRVADEAFGMEEIEDEEEEDEGDGEDDGEVQ